MQARTGDRRVDGLNDVAGVDVEINSVDPGSIAEAQGEVTEGDVADRIGAVGGGRHLARLKVAGGVDAEQFDRKVADRGAGGVRHRAGDRAVDGEGIRLRRRADAQGEGVIDREVAGSSGVEGHRAHGEVGEGCGAVGPRVGESNGLPPLG